jgi:hypothetical protein
MRVNVKFVHYPSAYTEGLISTVDILPDLEFATVGPIETLDIK